MYSLHELIDEIDVGGGESREILAMTSSDGFWWSDPGGTCPKEFIRGVDPGELEQGSKNGFRILTELIEGQDSNSIRMTIGDVQNPVMNHAPVAKRRDVIADQIRLFEKSGTPEIRLLLVSTEHHVDTMTNHHDHANVVTKFENSWGDDVKIGFLDEPTGIITFRFHVPDE